MQKAPDAVRGSRDASSPGLATGNEAHDSRRHGRSTRDCPGCGRELYGRRSTCGVRTCPACVDLWVGDHRQRWWQNLTHWSTSQSGDTGKVALLTLTAPGKDVLPQDQAGNVEPAAADAWNATCMERWRQVHRQAMAHARRRVGVAPRMLGRQVEPQGRGVWHIHPLMPYGTPRERRAVHAYNDALRSLGPRYGFGFNDRLFPKLEAWRAAVYVSKYFALGTSAKRKQTLAVWAREGARLPHSPAYISRDLTQATGCTMRALRRRRYMHCLIRSGEAREYPSGAIVLLATGEVLEDAPAAPRGP